MDLTELDTENEDVDLPESQTATFRFKNPHHDEVDIADNFTERHERRFYEAVLYLRNALGPDANIVVGELAHAVRALDEDGDPEPLYDVTSTLMVDETKLEDVDNPFVDVDEANREAESLRKDGYLQALRDVSSVLTEEDDLTQDHIFDLIEVRVNQDE